MKIVLWMGAAPNQKALANKIHASFPVSGIVVESRKGNTSRLTLDKLFGKVFERLFLFTIQKSWMLMQNHYAKLFGDYPPVEKLMVENINSDEVYEFTKTLQADLIVVSGTSLIKQHLLGLNPKVGIINLHTGLSPYIKGGPNCTNWCIATQQFHLIGNTIMWIDAGIDSGNIITTEFTELQATDNLSSIHLKVMEHAHSLYLRAIRFLMDGKMSNVQQNSIAEGKTYYTKQWTLGQKIRLVKNIPLLKRNIQRGNIIKLRDQIITIPL